LAAERRRRTDWRNCELIKPVTPCRLILFMIG
jgi:hypothetical protein